MSDGATQKVPLFSPVERFVAWTVGLTLAGAVIAFILWRVVFVQILPGEVGVRYSLLFGGTKIDQVLPEGFALKLPWDRIYIYETRIQRYPINFTALSLEGMKVHVEGAILYRPRLTEVAEMQKEVGPDYRERLVSPIAHSALREIAAHYNSHELYSIDYHRLRQQVLDHLQQHEAARYVEFDDVLIRAITLPPAVSAAIEEKLAQEQLAASYEFRLLSQKQEAERQRIEAIGIRTYYSIVSEALNKSLLTWRGIEATVELARSNNTKIVVVGGGQDQLPLILGGDITATSDTPSPVTAITPSQALKLPDWKQFPGLFPELRRQVSTSGASSSADPMGAVERTSGGQDEDAADRQAPAPPAEGRPEQQQ